MFTGIVEEVGAVDRLETLAAGARIRVRCRRVLDGIGVGDSIAVSGVCLTAVSFDANSFSADISPETLSRSTLGAMRPNTPVNLERALLPASRLGGHIMQGHIDGTGDFVCVDQVGDGNWWLKVRVPDEVERYTVEKGSIAIDGISLTVATLEGDVVSAAIIPTTYQETTLRERRAGDKMNIECDILAKYVEKLLATRDAKPKLSFDRLRELGY